VIDEDVLQPPSRSPPWRDANRSVRPLLWGFPGGQAQGIRLHYGVDRYWRHVANPRPLAMRTVAATFTRG